MAGNVQQLGMLIPRTGRDPKEFELLVSDESPSGPCRTIGTFHPQKVCDQDRRLAGLFLRFHHREVPQGQTAFELR